MTLRAVARPLLRHAIYPALESVWAAGFGLVGQTATRRRPALIRPAAAQRERVGILAPHPDDETVGCGGVALLHRAAGDRVDGLILTDGGDSRAGRAGRAAMITRRAAEARAAAAVLGLDSLEPAGLPEGMWPTAAGSAAIRAWLAARQPTLLYAPSGVDYHPEHLRVACALAAALAALPASAQPRVRIYEVFVPLGPALVTDVAPIAALRTCKAAALACYVSQAAGLSQVARRDHYAACLYGLPGAAEAFLTLPAPAYIALVAASTWPGAASPYRGLRSRPFTDPLAYLVGTRQRRALRRFTTETRRHGGRM